MKKKYGVPKIAGLASLKFLHANIHNNNFKAAFSSPNFDKYNLIVLYFTAIKQIEKNKLDHNVYELFNISYVPHTVIAQN